MNELSDLVQTIFSSNRAGELLKKAEHLLIMGLHSSEFIQGYELASEKVQVELGSTYLNFYLVQ